MTDRIESYERTNRAFWDSDADDYQAAHAAQIDQGPAAWGVWSIPESEVRAIGDVRGKGLMIGTEFLVDGRPEKAKPLVKEIIHAAEERDLLLLSCGTYDNTIRWIPPLNVTAGQINDGLQAFGEALKAVLK